MPNYNVTFTFTGHSPTYVVEASCEAEAYDVAFESFEDDGFPVEDIEWNSFDSDVTERMVARPIGYTSMRALLDQQALVEALNRQVEEEMRRSAAQAGLNAAVANYNRFTPDTATRTYVVTDPVYTRLVDVTPAAAPQPPARPATPGYTRLVR